MIIDCHAHLKWNRGNDIYDVESYLRDMDEDKIGMRMISALERYDIVHQDNVVTKTIKQHPDKLIGRAVLDPKERGMMKELHRMIDMGVLSAIELDLNEHCYSPEITPHMEEIMIVCEERGIIVSVFMGWGYHTMPAQWTFYVDRHPDLVIALLHMGTMGFRYGCVELAKDRKNLFAETPCTYEFPILHKAFTSIPQDKFLFSTRYPHKFSDCSIHTFDLLKTGSSLSEALYSKNAQRLLHLQDV